jgi:hypothetical protein
MLVMARLTDNSKTQQPSLKRSLSLWRLKRTGIQPDNVICVPRWVPATGFIASLVFVAMQVVVDVLN